jgi:hypothetical protein
MKPKEAPVSCRFEGLGLSKGEKCSEKFGWTYNAATAREPKRKPWFPMLFRIDKGDSE